MRLYALFLALLLALAAVYAAVSATSSPATMPVVDKDKRLAELADMLANRDSKIASLEARIAELEKQLGTSAAPSFPAKSKVGSPGAVPSLVASPQAQTVATGVKAPSSEQIKRENIGKVYVAGPTVSGKIATAQSSSANAMADEDTYQRIFNVLGVYLPEYKK